MVAPAADGTTDFAVLQNELKEQSKKIVLVAFDLLYLNGYDLRSPASRLTAPSSTASISAGGKPMISSTPEKWIMASTTPQRANYRRG